MSQYRSPHEFGCLAFIGLWTVCAFPVYFGITHLQEKVVDAIALVEEHNNGLNVPESKLKEAIEWKQFGAKNNSLMTHTIWYVAFPSAILAAAMSGAISWCKNTKIHRHNRTLPPNHDN
ncbi:MAG: hypothetical protein ISS69_16265 [Phycisphaerae bacterium]|nr:hypothetical protein [Planctomycetota bacterium]MBL7221665.1 hypothetical protein [Phycisphaerae bacterium]